MVFIFVQLGTKVKTIIGLAIKCKTLWICSCFVYFPYKIWVNIRHLQDRISKKKSDKSTIFCHIGHEPIRPELFIDCHLGPDAQLQGLRRTLRTLVIMVGAKLGSSSKSGVLDTGRIWVICAWRWEGPFGFPQDGGEEGRSWNGEIIIIALYFKH